MCMCWLLARELAKSALVLIFITKYSHYLAKDFLICDTAVGDEGSQSLSKLSVLWSQALVGPEEAFEFRESYPIFIYQHIFEGAWFDDSQCSPYNLCLHEALSYSIIELFDDAIITHFRALVSNLASMYFKLSALEIGEVSQRNHGA
ncbi:unnamed protein product [Merluccius merluccius]